MDHTAHLASEDTLQNVLCRPIKESQTKAHRFVEKIKESSLMKEAFLRTMVEAGEEPLAIIKGISNRWDIVKYMWRSTLSFSTLQHCTLHTAHCNLQHCSTDCINVLQVVLLVHGGVPDASPEAAHGKVPG